MPVLRRVFMWPSTGPVDGPWHHEPDRDALQRNAAGVLPLYAEALPELRLSSPAPELRVFVVDPDVESLPAGTTAIVCMDHAEGFQMAFCVPPDGLAQATPLARRRFVLDLAHGMVRFLAPLRGWDAAALDAVYDRLAATDLVLRWATRWKSAPGRRHRARAAFAMQPDGFGRAVLEIADRDGALVARSPAELAFDSSGWQDAADTLRWEGADRVRLVPYVDLLGRTLGPVTLSVGAGLAPDALAAPGDDPQQSPPWEVVVRRDPREEPAGAQVTVIGGGPMNGVPHAYDRALGDRLWQMTQPPWLQWWAPAGTNQLELWYDYAPARSGPDVRRVRGRVRATVRRSAREMQAADDPVLLAQQDCDALVALLRRRFDLAEPPGPLPAVWDPLPPT